MSNGDSKKGFWDIADVILKPVGGLVTALAVVYIGQQFSTTMARQQMIDSRFRLYSELMSAREQAETNLRKDMFTSIIGSFTKPEEVSLESKVLNMELLSQNFHESLNMKPLFIHLGNKIAVDPNATMADKVQYMKRLYRVAKEITRKQMVGLETHSDAFDTTISWQTGSDSNFGAITERTMTLDGITRDFRLYISGVNEETKELKVNLLIVTPKEHAEPVATSYSFGLGFFDFPMIDNIRLSQDQRCAVVLKNFAESSAEITVVYFPGSYASLKEKPYYQDVYERLLQSIKAPDESI